MICRSVTALLALAGLVTGLVASSAPSFAFGGGAGCPDLPEYYRAVGTVENGEGSCGMSMAEARRILARGNPEQPDAAPAPAPAPAPRVHHRHHHHHYRVAPAQ